VVLEQTVDKSSADKPVFRHVSRSAELLAYARIGRPDTWLIGSAALVLFALAVRLVGADQQSAYMDEGTNVLTGRMLIEQHSIYAEVLNWAYGSYLWPLVAGLADEVGGLRMVRGVTALCGLVMVVATVVSALRLAPRQLSQERRRGVALLAGGIIAIAPTAIAVGRFGTYDALAGAAFMLGVALLLPSDGEDAPIPAWLLLAAATLLFVAFLSKYLVAIYFPFVCLYVMLRHGTRIRAALHDALWFVIPLSALCIIYAVTFLAPLINLLSSSLHYGDLKSPDALREYIWNRPELWLLVLGVASGWRFASWRGRLVAGVGTAVIVGFQIVARPDFDFWKHSIYVIFFLAPIAGLSWMRVPLQSGTSRVVSVVGAAAIALLAWSPALDAADRLIDFYPNLNPSVEAIQPAVNNAALVLTDDTALRYYLYPAMSSDRIVGPFFFTYQSQNGLDAYRAAIADRFFDAIVLDGGVTPQGNAIRDTLSDTIQAAYQRVYSRDDAGFTVEVYKPVRPAGSAPAENGELNWPETYTFDAGADGWGAHPETGDWQEGLQITTIDTPAWTGHTSLEFIPTPQVSTLSMRHSGPVTRMRARVLLVPDDGSATPIRIGFMGFDSDWQWHDDGFRWLVPPNSWTTISWDLPNPGDYPEVGLKLPPGISRAYVGSFEIQP
jgi:hypothetical protein